MVLTVALLLEHLGEDAAARRVEHAVARVLEEGQVTPDLGGDLTTAAVGDAVVSHL